MSDPAEPEAPAKRGLLANVLFAIGSIGLIGAMLGDAGAVVGRHIGFPILGSIEIVQSFVVLAASAAILIATQRNEHASVHILTERLGPNTQQILARFASLLGALFFGALAASSIWIAVEMWPGAEETEMVRIPIAALRLFWIACCVGGTLFFLRRVVKP